MIGLDSNIVLRYLVRDHATQATAAQTIIDRELSSDEPGFINRLVLAEIAWVLRRLYGYSRAEIADATEALLSASCLRVEDADLVSVAASRARSGADLVDALLGASNSRAGCARTLTFDRRAGNLPEFEFRRTAP